MNIAMISYHTCPLAILGGKNTGGMNVYVRELTRHLGMQDVHVDVFTRSENEHEPHVSHDLGFGNRVVHIPAGPEVTLSKFELTNYLDVFADRIDEFVQSKGLRYELIHAHYWMSGISGLTLAKRWQVPVLQMFHTLGLVKQMIARSAEEMEGDYRFNGEKTVIEQVDAIIASTESERMQLKDMYHVPDKKIVIIPPGVDTTRFYPIDKSEAREAIGIPEEDRMVLFVGRIEPLKGIDTLIEAMAKLKMKCHRCPHYLVIIGGDADASPQETNSEMARLKTLSQELGIEDIIIFLGKRDQAKLPYYYSAAEVVVMPSHYESFGMVALEAMACGTPVIASEVGGLRNLIIEGETGFFIARQDSSTLSDKMKMLLLDDTLRNHISQKAAEYARSYDWANITEKMMGVYRKLTESSV